MNLYLHLYVFWMRQESMLENWVINTASFGNVPHPTPPVVTHNHWLGPTTSTIANDRENKAKYDQAGPWGWKQASGANKQEYY